MIQHAAMEGPVPMPMATWFSGSRHRRPQIWPRVPMHVHHYAHYIRKTSFHFSLLYKLFCPFYNLILEFCFQSQIIKHIQV